MMPFDYSAFLSQHTTEQGSTQLETCPEGEFHLMVDTEVPFERWFRPIEIKNGPNAGQSRVILRVPFIVDDERVKSELGRDRVTVSKDCWLDTLDDGITLDWSKGKNIDLGQLREALHMNEPGKPFGIEMLPGAGPLLGKIKHETYKDRVSAVVERMTAV